MTTDLKLRLGSPVEQLQPVGAGGRLLNKLGIRRCADLLFHFPTRYEEPAPLTQADDFTENLRVSFVGTIVDIDERITQSGKHMLGVQTEVDGGGFVRLLWFNQAYRKQGFRRGGKLQVTGVLRSTVLNWEMVQPQVSHLEGNEQPFNGKPAPVYRLTEGLKQFHLRRMIRESIPELLPLVEEVLPERMRQLLNVPSVQEALHDIHLPETQEHADRARRRFKLQELLVLQLALNLQRKERQRGEQAPACPAHGKVHARILNRLGLMLTGDQTRAIAEIGEDMGRSVPMNRLLQGDVGSGKTVVAQYAMLLCVAHGYQAAIMAPTEVLAQQHAKTLEASLASSRVRVALLTGSMPRSARRNLMESVAKGEIDLVVGTQALLSADLQFAKLGLVVVDEQHKFGVMQRAKLRIEGTQPHYLVLSATPIPRTIAMTAFGDLDTSTIREKPPGRAEVHSYVTSREQLDAWWQFVEKKLAEGRQAYVITPRVAASEVEAQETQEVANAEQVFAELRGSRFAQRQVGLLHGRLDSAEKESVLTAFAKRELDILVSTTVVEVGIDVPNATVMTILDANRLGLSQLHQLRGRISRGKHPGYVCAIATAGSDAQDHDRLKAFEQSNDGFELAELDLKIRGPGDLLGTSQSGAPRLRIANLTEDAELLTLARETAKHLLDEDPELAAADLAKLRQQTLKRYAGSMELSDIG